jgi:hypothetical protein
MYSQNRPSKTYRVSVSTYFCGHDKNMALQINRHMLIIQRLLVKKYRNVCKQQLTTFEVFKKYHKAFEELFKAKHFHRSSIIAY